MSLPLTASENTCFDEINCHTAYFTSQPDGTAMLVTARGEIDSVNSGPFAAFALRRATGDGQLTVDLSGVTFLGVDGVSALHTINDGCAARRTRWKLTVGPAVARVLGICAPLGDLPVSAGPASPASLQLVAQPT
jgi:anti-anti-sigma regulatory factor